MPLNEIDILRASAKAPLFPSEILISDILRKNYTTSDDKDEPEVS
jgi:hypothetical protein